MARQSFDSFWSEQFPKWAGAAAILGGVLWVLGASLHSLQPHGCLGQECATRAMRTTTGLVSFLVVTASVLLVVGIAGLILMARRSQGRTKQATAGMLLVAIGLATLLAVGVIQSLFFNGDLPVMPFIAIPAMAVVAVGLLLIGIFVLRSGVLPRWLAIFFIVSSVALVLANEQSAAVLLYIPFGLAMAVAGYLMGSGGTQRSAAPAARDVKA